jgi:hypothetical protein
MRRIISLFIIIFYWSAMASFAGAREEVRRDFQKTVTLATGKGFRIESSLGSIRIRTQQQSQADIRAVIKCSADTAAEAKSICDQIQISVQESASGVSVLTEYPRFQGGGRRNIGYGVDYEIAVPETTALDVRNRFGNVAVYDVRAASSINNSNGDVQISGGRGRQQIENSFGKVEVRANSGDVGVKTGNGDVLVSDTTGNVDVTDRFGKITVTRATGNVMINSNNGTIDLATVGGVASIVNTFGAVTVSGATGDVTVNNQNGGVRVTDVRGSADLRTTFDRISFTGIAKRVEVRASNTNVVGETVGENASVETTFGNVDLRAVKGSATITANNTTVTLRDISGEVRARTTFNGVTVSNAGGPVTVENQNGSVTVDSRVTRCQPMSLSTSFGPIRVTVPSGVGYNLSAKTTFGRINSEAELAVTGIVSADTLNGTIAGGGCALRLIGQNGNIDILKSVK